MAGLDESEDAESAAGANAQGLDVLSRSQEIVFSQYIRQVLPLDGYVFWIRTKQTKIKGSLHFSSDQQQNEDDGGVVNRVVFSTKTAIEAFNEIGQNVIWVGGADGIKFAFSQRLDFYRQAGLYHYRGDAVYPMMESQLVDLGSQFSDRTLIVSNSLPAWLALKSYSPIWLTVPNPEITLYPSFLIPNNLPSPYGAVHVVPGSTQALQGAPAFDRYANQAQLATDHIRVTLYGLTNDQALAWVDLVNQYSYDQGVIGIMNMPIINDGKRTQRELGILAMQKTIEFDVSYNQARIANTARQLLEHVTIQYFPREYEVA